MHVVLRCHSHQLLPCSGAILIELKYFSVGGRGSLVAGWWLSCNEVQPDRGRCFGAGVQPGQLAAPRTVPSHHVCDTTSALWCSSGHAHTCTHAHTHWSVALLSDIDKSRSAPHFYRKNSLLELLVFSPGLNTCCLLLFPALVLSSFGVLPTLLLRRVWTKGLCDPSQLSPHSSLQHLPIKPASLWVILTPLPGSAEMRHFLFVLL